MEELRDRIVEWLTDLLIAGIVLTPLLAGTRILWPALLPWWVVLVPLAGGLHLVLCWLGGRILARGLLNLLSLTGRR